MERGVREGGWEEGRRERGRMGGRERGRERERGGRRKETGRAHCAGDYGTALYAQGDVPLISMLDTPFHQGLPKTLCHHGHLCHPVQGEDGRLNSRNSTKQRMSQ